MKDKITLERIQTAHPKVREELTKAYDELCVKFDGKRVKIRFAYVIRTFAEQTAIYNQGRTTPGNVVTDAPAGLSYHNYGLAVDIVLLIDKDGDGKFEEASWDFMKDNDKDGIIDMNEIDEVFSKYGFKGLYKKSTGKRWDLPHFEKTLGYSIRDLKALWDAKKFIPNTNYVAI